MIFSLTTIIILAFTIFSIKFSSIYYILIGALLGLGVYLINLATQKVDITDEINKDEGDNAL